MPPKRSHADDMAAPSAASQSSAARPATRQTPVLPPPVPGIPIHSRVPPPPVPPPTTTATKAAHQQQQQQQQPISPPTTRTHQQSQTVHPPKLPAGMTHQTPVPVPKIPTSPEQINRSKARPPIAAKTQPQQAASKQQQQTLPGPTQAVLIAQQGTLRWAPPEIGAGQAPNKAVAAAAASLKENVRPPDLVAPEITYHIPQGQQHQPASKTSLVRPHGPSAQPPPRLGKAPPIVTPVHPPKPPTLQLPTRPPPRADRNIDKVVLGKLCFGTWYPSYYGKEVLGDMSGNVRSSDSNGSQDASGKGQSKRDRNQQGMLERLYVCPCCFKYSKELVAWWGHVRLCEQKAYVPGRRIYVHPRGRRRVLVPQDVNKGPAPKKRRGDSGVHYVEETVQDEGEWSIWEVDGEKEGLFCQNLSLFAKLFLDNKSVFFDVTGFHYFLLVYTPPAVPKPALGGIAPGGLKMQPQQFPPPPQVCGFFSKEKISWDNNNLACILVFPPWQRKGLGALLMGVSYEISRREGVLGGPEKPISDLGKKGYKRFWAGEIARWLLSDLESEYGPSSNGGAPTEELIVDIHDCSQATWIAVDDCLSTLRDMGVVTDAGIGPGKPVKMPENDENAEQNGDVAMASAGEPQQKQQEHDQQHQQHQQQQPQQQQQQQQQRPPAKLVARVRVDKEAVRRYVGSQRINLERTCDPTGFVEGYAMKEDDEDGDASEE